MSFGIIWPTSAMSRPGGWDVSQQWWREGNGILERISDLFLVRSQAVHFRAAAAAAPLDRRRLCRLAVRAAVAELYSLDDFSGLIVPEFTLSTYAQLLEEANVQIILRTVLMRRWSRSPARSSPFDRLLRGAVCARLDQSAVLSGGDDAALVELPRQDLCLEAHSGEGRHPHWVAETLHLSWLIHGLLAVPIIGGPSLSFSYIGTFLVFVYIWIPYMILPIQAALERVPVNYLEAAADLGAEPRQTFWTVVFPLALPGIIAGLDLHLLADARRLHRADHRRQFAPVHRHGCLHAARDCGKHSARCRLHRRTDGDYGRLPVHGEAHGAFDVL